METLVSFFRVYEVINHEVLTKLRVQMRTSIALVIYAIESMALLGHGE